MSQWDSGTTWPLVLNLISSYCIGGWSYDMCIYVQPDQRINRMKTLGISGFSSFWYKSHREKCRHNISPAWNILALAVLTPFKSNAHHPLPIHHKYIMWSQSKLTADFMKPLTCGIVAGYNTDSNIAILNHELCSCTNVYASRCGSRGRATLEVSHAYRFVLHYKYPMFRLKLARPRLLVSSNWANRVWG